MAETNHGQWCAIQCKGYADDAKLYLKIIDSFFAKASALEKIHKKDIRRILVFTGERMSIHVIKRVKDFNCHVIDQQAFREGNINWNDYPKKLTRKKPLPLREYQKKAVKKTVNALSNESRGKLIMACGTGKTLTSLRIAEEHAGIGKTVLYLVPSITLIQQTMQNWSANAKMEYHYEAICSDSSVKVKGDDSNIIDDGNINDIPIPATTDADTLKKRLSNKHPDAMTVLFSTYQSIEVIKNAMGNKEIDLILCDEAHRTTGIEGKLFQMVHDNDFIKAKKRIYMTATSKQFTTNLKKKHSNLVDMDDEKTFGKTAYHYSFSEAVDNEDLCDFKIRVPVFSEGDIEQYCQDSLDGNEDATIDERVLMAAVWHALNYGENENKLLQRVIAFGNTIKASEKFSGIYEGPDNTVDEEQYQKKYAQNDNNDKIDRSMLNVVNQYEAKKNKHTGNTISVRHVDGSMSSNVRHRKMDWLKSSLNSPHECRILSNARCLSEGIDVPALDGIVFLQPRKSQVDVIQAVGRVMRKVKGKDYGYIVIPVVLQKNSSLHESLETEKTWNSVWQVLKALRSHDPEFGKKIDKLALMSSTGRGGEVPENIEIIFMGSLSKGPTPDFLGKITSQMVKKCGDRQYYTHRSEELGIKAKKIEKILSDSYNKTQDKRICKIADELHKGLQTIINDSVTINATIQVMAQHYALSKVFNALFQDEFTADNPIVRVLDDAISQIGLTRELDEYAEFFDSIKKETQQFKNSEEKETYIKEIYGSFLKGFDKLKQESEGIVYTPTEVVDFIIHSVEHLLREEFGTGFNRNNVKIFDPFTGTGTFIARLLESGLIKTNHLEAKYKNDIYANEMSLLAYYVATVNIESVFKRISKNDKHASFRNINYTDTLNHHPKYRMDMQYRQITKPLTGNMSKVQDSIQRSKWEHIHVIVGNPPYSGGQSSFDDQNPNIPYPVIDRRIDDTYIKMVKKINSKISQTRSLYDSYVRSIRWASDRIGESGVIGFVTNGSFIRSDTGVGIRACLKEEFTDVWVFDLRGNQRTQGEVSRKEGGKIFGSGSRAPVTITIMVKNPKKKTHNIHYYDIGDYYSREKKLELIRKFISINGIKDWQEIEPDKHHDWLNQRTGEFSKYLPMGSKDAKAGKGNVLFRIYSNGVKTNRDAWAYNSSYKELSKNMLTHINYCNSQDLDNPKINPKQAKWTEELSDVIKRNNKPKFVKQKIRHALYKPFFKQLLYFDHVFNPRQGIAPMCFPKKSSKNLTICVSYHVNVEFSSIISDITPDVQLNKNGQCFSLKIKNKNSNDKEMMQDNITEHALNEYQKYYNNKTITKEDIFYYVYGILHHIEYKKKYANNLTKELPHIPMAPDFYGFSNTGKKLADLHLSYETCSRYNLGKPKAEFGKYQKMKFIKKKNENGKQITDKTTLKINGIITFDNIPIVKYHVNGRSPLEWAIDRYKIKIDPKSGIVNDSTNVDIIPLIERLVYVGVESDRLISELPVEFEPKDWKPVKTGIDQFIDGIEIQSKLA